jgi:hypothetical protein
MWQPIETAPKDGTKIDLWVVHETYRRRVPDAYWLGDAKQPPFFDDERMEGWAAANMGYDGCDGWADEPDDNDRATHWMPLPKPPR